MILGAREYHIKESGKLKIELVFLEKGKNKQGLSILVIN